MAPAAAISTAMARWWSTACASRSGTAPIVFQFSRSALQSVRRRGFVTRRCSVQQPSVQEKPREEAAVEGFSEEGSWGKVSAVLFDMDGVLCNSEDLSRRAAVDLFTEIGVSVCSEDFVPFMGTGEANFLGGVAKVKGVLDFDPIAAKKRFFEIYLEKYAKPESGIGFPGALKLVEECKSRGLKVAVASSADRIKVDANLAAAGLPSSMFDAIVSADAFANLKPAPDIFLAAAKILNLPPSECIVIEDALAGVQAAQAAGMRCIAVTTTLSEEKLPKAEPSLIRQDIENITIIDILDGDSEGRNKFHNPKVVPSEETNTEQLVENVNKDLLKEVEVSSDDNSAGWVKDSRRDIIRYGSLAIAMSCVIFTVNNWKAMQYTSPKALINLLFGVTRPNFAQGEGDPRGEKIQQILSYIADIDSRSDTQKVPEFPKLDWLNTSPLQFSRDLRGKVVLLDFWTYCCINCMHVLPDLEYLENKYKDLPFTVIGVHSAKFDNEKDLEAIRNAVLRYNVTHPVVNDGDMNLWRGLGVNSWPTFVMVAPDGKVLAQIAGEGQQKNLDYLVEAALQYYGKKKELSTSPLPLSLEKDKSDTLLSSVLKFPGKLEVDLLNNRLFISDSNHNRIVVTDLEGNFVLQVGGTGEEGMQDGSFDVACFNRPQGLAYNPKKNILYVADTENHAVREVDFVNETVRTIAGNGTKGSDYKGGRVGVSQVLNSPWDVCFNPSNDTIYIAMAGQHQIWEHNTSTAVSRAFSGDGFERNLNGSSSKNTSFAQPSGMSFSPDMQDLYVADSESSSIRVVNLKTGGSRLLAGGDPVFSDNLFRFGDHDGIGTDALFQHPLGVFCGSDGQIYVADSYNHKIKKLDLVTKRVVTIAGTGKAGYKDGAALLAQLSEPSGIISVGSGRLLIADTNNNTIRLLDLNEDPVLRTLELKGVLPPSPRPKSMRRLRRRQATEASFIKVDGGSSSEGNLNIRISLPPGYHFSKEAQSKYDVDTESEREIMINPTEGILNSEGSTSLHFKRAKSTPVMQRINVKVYYCKEDEVCLYQALAFEVSFQEEQQNSEVSEIGLRFLVEPRTPTGSLPMFSSS
ncbi:haloacid dehalogenase-like hydrolase family protein [Wolffia australiana]